MEMSSHNTNKLLHKKSLNVNALLRKKSLLLSNKHNLFEIANQNKRKGIIRSKTIKLNDPTISELKHDIKDSPITDLSSHLRLNKIQSNNNLEKIEEIDFKEEIKKDINDKIHKSSRRLVKINKVYDSVDDEEIEDLEEDKKHNDTYIITLDSYFKFFWDMYMFTLILLTTLISPIKICFEISDLSIVEAFFEFFLIIDIFLSFFTQIQDFNENLINSKRTIAFEYLQNWFIIDLISSLPLNMMEIFFKLESFWLKFMRWTVILRFFKFQKYHYVKDIKIFNDSKLGRLTKLFIYFILMINISSCFWIYIARTSNNINNWIYDTHLDDSSYYEIYIASMYFNLVTIYSVGYGDITCINNYERYYNILLLFFGVMLYSFGLTSLSKIFVEENPSRTKYLNKLSYLKEISNIFDINDELYNSVKSTLWMEHEKNYADRFEFLDNLPTKIKHELTGFIYDVLIKELVFFKEQPNDFLLFVMPFLKSHQLERNQILFSTGEVLEEMYLVVSGILSLNLGPIYEFMEISVIKGDNHFGDVFLQTNEISPFELKCKSKTSEVFMLRKADYEKIKLSYNKNILDILEKSYKVLENIRKKKDQIVKLLTHEKSIFNVKNLINRLNLYLFQKGFNDFFFKGKPFEDINEFLSNTEAWRINQIIKQIDKKKKISRSSNLTRLGDNLRRSIIESKLKKLDVIKVNPNNLETNKEDKDNFIHETQQPEEESNRDLGNKLLEFNMELRAIDEKIQKDRMKKEMKRKKKKKFMKMFNVNIINSEKIRFLNEQNISTRKHRDRVNQKRKPNY